uniref:Fatty acid synthase 2 n=1 Tax=Erpetoichthys calabaricus TaxID=27687 RepID=A0A8C4RWT5_ERPCA
WLRVGLIIYLGCNWEGVDNFWRILLEGRNCTVEIPSERFSCTFWYDSSDSKPGKSRTVRAALIDGFNELDHRLFGISEAEADRMDPQQKLLLECTYRALEDAGIPMEMASGSKTGVFIGLMNHDYEMILNNSASNIDHYNGTGTATSIAANRISYCFNFTGPSLAIDSACSSSLVALHYACQAIKQGDCDMAICGGVSCIIEPRVYVALSKAKMVSPDGTSKPFSSSADGYGRGEGCGIVLLKPLTKAMTDLHRIRGIITCSAVNQDGRTVMPITRPSMMQQEQLLHSIYSKHVDPSHIQYIEAHGTGTSVGDPTEANSISNAIAKFRSAGSPSLVIGSVKGNIGHTESAAGIAGLIKILLMMQHETIVPSLHYSKDSASIDTEALNLKIPTKAEKWESSGPFGRAAGVNNFGFGGTNAHVVVQQYKETRVLNHRVQKTLKLFVLSAASEKAIHMTMADIVRKIDSSVSLELHDLAYTSACRRSHAKHRYRKAFVTSTLGNLSKQIQTTVKMKIAASKSDRHLVFVFCGNGVTYKGMCKQLIKEENIFREKIIEIENIFNDYDSIRLLDRLENEMDYDDFSKPNIIQPLLFAIQVALSSLLSQWGIKPNAVLGHSVGEVAAAHCSGLLSLEDAVKVIYYRSLLQGKVTGGKMLVVSNFPVSDILGFVNAYSGKISIAAFNSPRSCTLSGDAEAIDDVHQKLSSTFSSKSIFLHALDVPAAYHSHMMDPILKVIEEKIGLLQTGPMTTDLISTVTGEFVSTGDFNTGHYWAKNVREPVSFEQAVKASVFGKKDLVFLEIGPRRALQRNIVEILGSETLIFPIVQPDKDYETLLTVVTKLFELGFDISWEQFYQGTETLPSPYPRYQFDCIKKEVSFEMVRQGKETVGSSAHPVLHCVGNNGTEFVCDISIDSSPYVYEHKNNGIAIVPGALYVELGLAAVFASLKPKLPLRSLRISAGFHSPCTINQNFIELKLQLEPFAGETTFKIHSSKTTFASGSVQHNSLVHEKNILVKEIYKRCTIIVKSDEVYEKLFQAGFQYGPVLRQLREVNYGKEFEEAITKIKVPLEVLEELHEYCIHPVILDYFMQMTAVVVMSSSKPRPGFPSAVGSLIVSQPLQEDMFLYLRTTKETPEICEVCGAFTNEEGLVLAELQQVTIRFLGTHNSVVTKFFYQNNWKKVTEKPVSQIAPIALVFADQLGVARTLKAYLDPKSVFVSQKRQDRGSTVEINELLTKSNIQVNGRSFDMILFLWGIQNLSDLSSQMVLEHIVSCCEAYRQMILYLKENNLAFPVRTITYRTSEWTVDHINPGFALSGMTRACAAEIATLSFQLIDVSSVSNEDMCALAEVISSYEGKHFPEIAINKGHIYTADISRTPTKISNHGKPKISSSPSESVVLRTTDPYNITGLYAELTTDNEKPPGRQSVKVQIKKICLHSCDFFPVSFSDLSFAQTLYWNKHASTGHNLLVLDFCGVIAGLGRDVKKWKVGDPIVSCFPIMASSQVILPESVCYDGHKFPSLMETPCLSHFILSWEILQITLPKVKHQKRLAIFTSAPESSLTKVLQFSAGRSGWMVSVEHYSQCQVNKYNAVVVLPPYDTQVLQEVCFSTAKHIVIVCENHGTHPLSKNLLRFESEETHVHVLQVSHIFQKAFLKKHKIDVYNTVYSCSDTMSLEHPGSYFTTKSIPLVIMDKLLENRDISCIPVHQNQRMFFKKNSVYIVTGGLSGLGFETVKFIAQRGGGYIVILSRSGPNPERQFDIANLNNMFGTTISSICCDVGILRDVEKAVAAIRHTFPKVPIRGVFHSAVVLHDGLIQTLNKSHYEQVMRPKVAGVLNLHNTTRHCQLDYFVCYSSITSFVGNSAQTNYAAANSFLDTFCHYRRRMGLSGQSINWGALNLGLLLNKDSFQRFLESKGMMIMESSEILEGLENCLLQDNPQQAVCKFNFQNLNNHVLSQNASLRRRFFTVVTEELKNMKANVQQDLQANSASSPDIYIKSLICEITHTNTEELKEDTSLYILGIDSMLAMTLQNRVFQERNVELPLITLLDSNTTVSMLVSLLRANDRGTGQEEQQLSLKESEIIDSEGEGTWF